ncbi:hypothetical protein HanRHA438_Chr11g0489941 [Helianthus annuus]|nr:hypothetical protein HanRHA438_Chr11g0489941 [Helianthus annuus]
MGGPTTSAHGPTTPVKHNKFNSKLFCNIFQLFLSFVKLPRSRKPPSVFSGIGVPDHDFLFPVNSVFVPIN